MFFVIRIVQKLSNFDYYKKAHVLFELTSEFRPTLRYENLKNLVLKNLH